MSATRTTSAEQTIKDLWSTRPRRPRRGRKIAGVAAGIANRYRIDPVLVRVGLVVAAIYGGAGVLVYLLGWLFLPEQDDDVAPFEALIGKGRSSMSTAFTLLLCIALIPTFSWFFSEGFLPGWLGLIVVGGLLYLLHHSRGHLRPVDPSVPAPAAAPVPDLPLPPLPTMPTMPMATTESPMTATQNPGSPVPPVPPMSPEPERTTPPAWDPLGAAPFAWDLPDPAPPPEQEPEPPVRRPKSKIGVLTVGAALVIGGGLAMVGWLDPQHIIGVVLAIFGIGMVIGAFVRGGRGLIGLAVPLSLLGIGMTVVTPDGWHGVLDVDSSPTSVNQVQEEYRGSVGSIRLDLTGLPETGELETKIDLDAGDVEVILPPTADVELKCENDLGDANCLNYSSSGPDNDLPKIEDLGTDDKPGGLKIDMKVEVGTGTLEVRRG